MTGRSAGHTAGFDSALAAARASLHGRSLEARERAAAVCSSWPDRVDGWLLLAEAAARTGDPVGALEATRRAVRIAPENGRWLTLLARRLLAVRQPAEAARAAEHAAVLTPDDATTLGDAGCVLAAVNRHREAVALFERATRIAPETAAHWFNLAMEQRALGLSEEAEASCDRVIAIDPDEHEAYLIRSQLRRQTRERNHIHEIAGRLESGVRDWRGETKLLYALAKEQEDLGLWDAAYSTLEQGAAARRRRMNYDVGRDIATMDAIVTAFPASRFEETADEGFSSDEPIFIVGMPRTGSTLVERILGSHPDVHAAGELAAFPEAMMAELAPVPPGDRAALARHAAALDMERLGRSYIERTRPRTGYTRRFIDKLPLNFLYCGLIRLSLPRARIIHVVRDPLDTLHAVFKTYFAGGYPFSYDLDELSAYYAAYRRLMAHWHSVMPGSILDLSYERLVEDLEGQARRLIDYCGLDWSAACLEFHRNAAPSTTASADQVRRPLYDTSVGQSRRYPVLVDTVRRALALHGVALPAGKESHGGAA